MISTQRLMLLIIIVNMMITVGHDMYYKNTNYFEAFQTSTTEIENANYDLEEQESWTTRATTFLTDNAVFNVVKVFWTMGDIFLRSWWPFSINPTSYNTAAEQIAAYIIVLLRGLMYMITAIEIVNWWINKKAT